VSSGVSFNLYDPLYGVRYTEGSWYGES
jgi:hypothetical protein